jgi:hypothetical protein
MMNITFRNVTQYHLVDVIEISENILPPSSGFKNKSSKKQTEEQHCLLVIRQLFFDTNRQTVYSSEMSINFYHTTWRHITKDRIIFSQPREHIKSNKIYDRLRLFKV